MTLFRGQRPGFCGLLRVFRSCIRYAGRGGYSPVACGAVRVFFSQKSGSFSMHCSARAHIRRARQPMPPIGGKENRKK